MSDLKIDSLGINIRNAAGHEHRVHPITLRAIAILGERLESLHGGSSNLSIAHVSVPPVNLDLGRMSDEAAATSIAEALLGALALRLRT